MNSGQMVFSQLMDCLPWWRFHPIVEQYQGNHKVKQFSCSEHFRVMAFAQLTHRKSLRDVEVAFNAIGKKAYHMGIKTRVAKSTLADANAVKVQVWIAVCTYLIVAILKKEQRLLQPMSEILQVLSILQFEKRPVSELFTALNYNSEHGDIYNQLPLFDL